MFIFQLPFGLQGHHYQMALLDRVHDAGRLVTIMGNRASHLEAEIEKLKFEGDPEQLAIAHQRVVELQANNAKKYLNWERQPDDDWTRPTGSLTKLEPNWRIVNARLKNKKQVVRR
ncbi:hypothetical protein B296_00015072 [Ensete ventricosum]|uniref:Uncharacterized protein n=1 Tax=Ensete ventricosum TaxID=4639 RepID=A0A427B705_ENSVE|nr:hypothetical protein B296_00015072 [Ensete ventricosum]